jgi:uncharacterized protein YndB with AHSA1/START domain
MSEAVTTAHEIVITRILPAPRELVWRAWTDPDHLALWWGARGWSTAPSDVTVDPRPGGIFNVGSTSDEDQTEMTTHGVFREVDPPHRLVLDEPGDDAWHDGAVSELTLAERPDGQTEMVLRVTVHTSDEALRQAEAGLTSAIDRLEEALR